MSVPETSAPYAPQPQGAPEVTTRRGLLDRLTARLTGLYDAREARSIALVALAELAGLPLSALLLRISDQRSSPARSRGG